MGHMYLLCTAQLLKFCIRLDNVILVFCSMIFQKSQLSKIVKLSIGR